MATIFLSYRREDSAAHAGRLYDRLSAHFGKANVFMDIDTIDLGEDFVEAITKTVGACDVLIALIGRQWLTAADAEGRRRLEKSDDFVRMEIAAALERNIRVVPALVGGASMPAAEGLPQPLAKLATRNGLQISDERFHQKRRSIGRVDRARSWRFVAEPSPNFCESKSSAADIPPTHSHRNFCSGRTGDGVANLYSPTNLRARPYVCGPRPATRWNRDRPR